MIRDLILYELAGVGPASDPFAKLHGMGNADWMVA